MSFDSIDLWDHDTLRRLTYLASDSKNFVSPGFALYHATQFIPHPAASNLFTPITRIYAKKPSAERSTVLPDAMLQQVEAQLQQFMPKNCVDVCTMVLNNPYVDFACKLNVFQKALSGQLSEFQIEELSKVLSCYVDQTEALITKNPQGVLNIWFINQVNCLALLVHLHLLYRHHAYDMLRFCKYSLQNFFDFNQLFAQLQSSALYQWLFHYNNACINLSDAEPYSILAQGFFLDWPDVKSQHPFVLGVKGLWLRACFVENPELLMHVEQGGAAQRFLKEHYKISRSVFRFLNQVPDLPFSLTETPILLGVVLSKLPRSYWPKNVDEFEKFGFKLISIASLPIRLQPMALMVLEKHQKIEFVQLESLLVENEYLLRLLFPEMAENEIERFLLKLYSRSKNIQLRSVISKLTAYRTELSEPIFCKSKLTNSQSFGFSVSGLQPEIYSLFSREWQNCLGQYQVLVALAICKIFLLQCQQTNELYLLEVSLHPNGNLQAIQLKDADNKNASFAFLNQVRHWLATQNVQRDHAAIPQSLVIRCRSLITCAFPRFFQDC